MDEIEKALKTALQREPAPVHLAARVHRKINPLQQPAAPWWRLPQIRWATVGVAAIACVVGAISEHRQQQLRGQHARQQVLLALRITGSKLRIVQDQVLKAHAEGESRP